MGDTPAAIKIEDVPVKGAGQQDVEDALLRGLALLTATIRWGWQDRALAPGVLERRMTRVDQLAERAGWASDLRDHLRRAETQAQTALN